MRWIALLPLALAVPYAVLSLYPPVGEFLGGYGAPWMYKLAYLIFAMVASFAGVVVAKTIAPTGKRAAALALAITFFVLACLQMLYTRNPQWPDWYIAVYLSCVVAGGLAACFLEQLINAIADIETAAQSSCEER